jgi:hypothetical protein
VSDIVIRFLVGGVIVSIFAALGDLFRPKSFAGLFGAAPSVALATLALTSAKHDTFFVAAEGASMVAGAVALAIYSHIVSWLMMRYKLHAMVVTILAVFPWFCVAFSLWAIFLR